MEGLNSEAIVGLFVFLVANIILLICGLVNGARTLGRMENKIGHINGLNTQVQAQGRHIAAIESSVKLCQDVHLGAED